MCDLSCVSACFLHQGFQCGGDIEPFELGFFERVGHLLEFPSCVCDLIRGHGFAQPGLQRGFLGTQRFEACVELLLPLGQGAFLFEKLLAQGCLLPAQLGSAGCRGGDGAVCQWGAVCCR